LAIGILFVLFMLTLIIVYRKKGSTSSTGQGAIPKEQEKAMRGLDEILKCLYAFIAFRLMSRFPGEAGAKTGLRASTILNELVLSDLFPDQIQFRAANAEFLDEEKIELMAVLEFKKGVVSYLACRGGLYKSWGSPKSDRWIDQAIKIDPEAEIPSTVQAVNEKIARILLHYRKNPL
jgi:hypothetical protein